jgi:hypothetical protein
VRPVRPRLHGSYPVALALAAVAASPHDALRFLAKFRLTGDEVVLDGPHREART